MDDDEKLTHGNTEGRRSDKRDRCMFKSRGRLKAKKDWEGRFHDSYVCGRSVGEKLVTDFGKGEITEANAEVADTMGSLGRRSRAYISRGDEMQDM